MAAGNVNLTPLNDSPIATDETYSVTVGSTTNLDVLANDFDVDLDILSTTVSVVNDPLIGSLVSNTDGSFDYTAIATGNDSFT